MKELLLFSKNLEKDFVNENKDYQSKIDLGISSLVTNDFSKAKQMFDSAIELDSLFPSAWIGKAFSEIAFVSDDDFNSLEIDEYLNRALKSKEDLTKYKVALAGCLSYRHSVIIKKSVIAVERFLEEQKKAKKQKQKAISTAIVGTMFTGKDKSITSNVVGGALIAGGAASAISANVKEKEFEQLANSLYSKALGQTYLSAPILYLCGTLIDKINDSSLKNNFNVVIDSWKESIIYLYQKQKEQLIKTLKELKVSDASRIESLLENPSSVQEIGEFTTFMKIIGLSNHEVCKELDNLFKVELKKRFETDSSKKDLEKAKKKQNIATGLGVGIFVVGFVSIYFDISKENQWIPWLIDVLSIIVFLSLYNSAKSSEMKDFESFYLKVVNKISNIKITNSDININLIKSESSQNNYNILDN